MTPWIALAATLAEQGLPALAERFRKQPATVVREVADALGTPRQPSAIEAALASDPAAIDKLAAIELDVFAAEEDSRRAAREAWGGTWVMGFTAAFATMVLGVFFWVLYQLAHGAIPSENAGAFQDQTKVLEYVIIAVVSFFFGSSVGSKINGKKL